MPLVIVTGLPSSGKSTLARKLRLELEARLQSDKISRQVRIVSDGDQLDWEGRNSIYTSITKEKELRSWLRAETQRYINLNQIVILDASVYIKGFRYELYCISKEAKTQYCVVEIFTPAELCWRWNENLLAKSQTVPQQDDDDDEVQAGYTRQTFDALLMRYEKCDENNRWDSPLFRINSDNEALDFDELYRILTREDPLVPNKCTSLTQTTSTIFKPAK